MADQLKLQVISDSAGEPPLNPGRTAETLPAELVKQVVQLRLAGVSLSKIEQITGCDRRTVYAAEQRARQSGLLPSIREELLNRINDIAITAVARLQTALDENEINPTQLAIITGIAVDKRATLMTEPESVGVSDASRGDPVATLESAYRRLLACGGSDATVVVDAVEPESPSTGDQSPGP